MKTSTDAATKAARLAQRSLEQVGSNARLDERAWVTITHSTLDKPLAIGEAPIVTLTLANSGKTPALKVKTAGKVYIGNSPVSSSEIDRTAINESVIGPNGEIGTQRESDDQIRDNNAMKAIKDDTVRLYAIGSISYWDVFERQHTTNFCMFISGKWLEKKTMVLCDSGNTAE